MAPRDYETVSAPGSWPAVRSATRDFLDKPESSCAAFAFKYFMLFAILSAVTLMVLGSLPRYKEGRDYHTQYDEPFKAAELMFNIVFFIEFIVRCAVGEDRLRDVFLFFDFISVIPFFLENILGIEGEGVIFIVLKALRVVRLLKIARQFDASIIITRAIKISLAALLVPFFTMMVAIIIFASVLFYLELEAGGGTDGGDSAFHSIPHAIWFMFVTMTTVGYGDVSPNTGEGKAITVVAMVFGVLFLSMPLAIVGNNFCEIWDDRLRVIFLEKFKEMFLSKSGVTRSGLERAFAQIDKDGSGTITPKELRVSLEVMNVQVCCARALPPDTRGAGAGGGGNAA